MEKERKASVSTPSRICTNFNDRDSYYRLTMYYYALSLSRAQFLMVNSSWTRNHIASIISHEHFGPVIQWAHRVTPLLFIKLCLSGSAAPLVMHSSGSRIGNRTDVVKPVIVYPPCDTREMARFSLRGRERIILSVAQFRYVDCCITTGTRLPIIGMMIGQRKIFQYNFMRLHNF